MPTNLYTESFRPRYTSYMQLDGTWGPTTIADYQRANVYGLYKVDLQRNPKDVTGWRSPSGYEMRTHKVSGCEVVIDAESIPVLGGSPTRIYQQGWDSFGDMVFPARPPYPQNLEGRTVNEALSSLKDQKIHLGVAFGERKETAEFVAEALKDAARLARSVRKRDLKAVKDQLLGRGKRQRHAKENLREVLDAPSKLVLQNSYALQPMLNDIYGSVDLLNEKDRADPQRYSVRARVTRKEDFYEETEFSRDLYFCRCWFVSKHKGFHGCMVRLDYYIENPFLQTLTQLGLTNPAQLAWELIPLSFVVDWAYPLGSYLDTLDADVGLSFRGGSISRLTKTDVTYAVSSRGNQPTSVAYRVNVREKRISGSGHSSFLLRSPLQNSPAGRLPSLESPFSSGGRVMSALALLNVLSRK